MSYHTSSFCSASSFLREFEGVTMSVVEGESDVINPVENSEDGYHVGPQMPVLKKWQT
jgi:hypothetical protein